MSLVQALHIAAATATKAVNAQGDTIVARLQDVRNRAQEVARHEARRGTAVAITVVQTMSGSDYRTFHLVLPQDVEEREEFPELVDDLSVVASTIAEDIIINTVIGNVFADE